MGIALALAVLILGLMLAPVARWLEQLEATARFQEWMQRLPAGAAANMANYLAGAPPPPEPKGPKVLIWFAVFVAVLTLITLVTYWPSIQVTKDEMFFWVWLFVMMVFGMFVQVLALNRSAGRKFYAVDGSQLLYPLLFSPVVFYPILAISASAPKGFFPFYAAFLNGYFWETLVSTVKPPSGP